MIITAEEMRNYIMVLEDGTEQGIFTGHLPRQAALKIANRSKGTKENPVEIRIRERGTKRIHVFTGGRYLSDAPKEKPEWLPAQIYRPFVKKVKIITPK